jgi:Ca2+-binding EF-hand superfamily protein
MESAKSPATLAPSAQSWTTRDEIPRSTIWKKLERFDKDKDGKLRLLEIYDVFRTIGFSPTWSWVSAVSTALYRAPQSSGRLTLSIDLAHIERSLIKGQTGIWNDRANPIPERVTAFLAAVDANRDGKVTLDEICVLVTADARASIARHPPIVPAFAAITRKRRFVESFSAWVQLMEVASHRDAYGQRYLTLDQVAAVFDGTLFDKILSQPPRQERISAIRVIKELFGPAVDV